MKTLLSAVALSGLLLAVSAGNPAAATEDHRRDAPVGVSVWSQAQASSQTELRYVHDNGDDDDWRYQPWPNNGNNGNGSWNNNGYNSWNGNWNNNWNNRPPSYQNQNYGRPLPERVIVFKLRQQHFYNVQKIKAKKGYYRVYAYRPVAPPGGSDRESVYGPDPARRTSLTGTRMQGAGRIGRQIHRAPNDL